MQIALCQIDNTVGDLAGNVQRIAASARAASARGAELAVFPELALTGYPPRDLVEKPSFLERTQPRSTISPPPRATSRWASSVVTSAAPPRVPRTAPPIQPPSSVAAEICFRQTKILLPTYDVFDESRNFQPAASQEICHFRGRRIALSICEDAWNDKQFWERPLYTRDPVADLARQGADLLIVINGSPYHLGKRALRRDVFRAVALHHRLPLVYVNMTGGNDQLVFDGSSFCVGPDGEIAAAAKSFEEDLVLFDAAARTGDRHDNLADEIEAVYAALVMGTRDYLRKCGFQRVLIGLSGGIDSTLVACIAADAVGPENVVGVAMPGPFSSDHSLTDARALAANLGLRFEIVPISGAYSNLVEHLAPVFGDAAPGVTEENIQARLRGLTLDGAVEQVERPRAHHRQQERDGGRLLHPLRRHVRRAGRHQRRAQDHGLRPVPRGERAPRPRGSRERLPQAALGRAAA